MTAATNTPLPSADLTLRAIEPGDTPEWARLTCVLADLDGTGEDYTAEDLLDSLTFTGVDPSRDTFSMWDGERMVGYGQVGAAENPTAQGHARISIDGGVDPEYRGRGIGSRLLDLCERRGLELGAAKHPGLYLALRASGGIEGSSARTLLEERDYIPARYFTDMGIDLPVEPVEAGKDDADAPVPFTPDLGEALRLAHNEAFSTHWGSTAQAPKAWAEMLAATSSRPDTTRVVVEGGDVLAYCITQQWSDGELYVALVGTVARARGRGLARRVLRAALEAGSQQGYRSAKLDVDSAHPSGAETLYSSVGFTPIRTQATYVRLVDARGNAAPAAEIDSVHE